MFAFIDKWLQGGRRKRAAMAVGLEAGALAECPVCRAVTDTGCTSCLQQAEALGLGWLEWGDERVKPFRHQPEQLHQELIRVVDQSPVDCICDVGGE